MNRTPLLAGGLFLAIVGAGAIWLGPMLLHRPPRTTAPPADRPAPGSPVGSRGTPGAESAMGPSSVTTERAWKLPKLIVTRPDGTPLPVGVERRFAGGFEERGFGGTWIGAAGFAWTRLPPTDADGVVRVLLTTAAPECVLTVRESDGSPAANVPISYAFDGREPYSTRGDGTLVIGSMPAGVLRVNVGSGARAAPPLRVRMGVDGSAAVTLEPGWVITVHVEDEAGKPIERADVAGFGFDGIRTGRGRRGLDWVPDDTGEPPREIVTNREGIARVVTRIDERLAIFVGASGRATVAVRAAMPDPRSALSSDITVRLRGEGEGAILGSLHWPAANLHWLHTRVEPAVLAPAREWFGREDVVAEPGLSLEVGSAGDHGEFNLTGLDSAVPWRLSLRGPVVPEDHVIDLADSPSVIVLRPEARAPDAGPVADSPAGPESASLRGRVTDVKGTPLRGVTVGTEGRRAVTDPDGMFVLPGVPKGRTLDVVYGWVDGADPGPAVPQEFAPWFEARVSASDEILSLTLPRAAAVKLRLTDGMSGTPLSWARVLILDGDGNVRFDAPVATTDGHASLEGLVPGTAGMLYAFAPGLRREVPLVLHAGETVDAGEVGLVRAGRVSGTVKDHAGSVIAGAAVAVMEDGRLERGGRSVVYGRDLVLRRTKTDEQGGFVLEGVDTSRPAAIGIAADGYASTARRVLWTEGADATLAVTLVRGGTARLQLLDPQGGRVSGAFVELEDARTGVRATDLLRRAALGSFVASIEDVRRASAALLTEDAKSPGTYRLGPVEPGPYDVIVTCPGFAPQRAKFTIPEVFSDARRSIPIETLDWRLELTPLPAGR